LTVYREAFLPIVFCNKLLKLYIKHKLETTFDAQPEHSWTKTFDKHGQEFAVVLPNLHGDIKYHFIYNYIQNSLTEY